MRKTLLTLTLVVMLVLPVLAQRQRGGFGFGGGQMGGDMLLMNKSVQEELKLDDKQKKALSEIAKAGQTAREKGMEAFKDGDKEKAMEIFKKSGEESLAGLKKFKEGLNTLQGKRFGEIQIQIAKKNNDANIFKRDDVIKTLKLSDKQKASITETLSDLEKDAKEVMEDAKGDRKKGQEARTKVAGLRKEAYEKISKSLTDDQVKSLKDMAGADFEYKPEGGGRGFGKDKGKGGKKDKKNDF